MKSKKIVQFSRPASPLCPCTYKIFPPFCLWGSNFKRMPPLQIITNQLKVNIIKGWLLYVIKSFIQVGFRFHSLILSGFPLTSFYQASLSAFSWVILLYVQLSKNITKCLLFTIIHIFSTDFESDCFLCTGPPCMWTTEIKTKIKPSYFTFKLSTRSIVRFSPQTMKWYH